jgi:hypothetical protein
MAEDTVNGAGEAWGEDGAPPASLTPPAAPTENAAAEVADAGQWFREQRRRLKGLRRRPRADGAAPGKLYRRG